MIGAQADWIERQCGQSQHPRDFWKNIADMVADGRRTLASPPDQPLGPLMYEVARVGAMLIDRNNKGIALERQGKVDAAIVVYEVSIADGFDGSHPYDRLRVLYSKKKWYTDAIRVCEAYLGLPDRPAGQDKPVYRKHLQKLSARLDLEAGRQPD